MSFLDVLPSESQRRSVSNKTSLSKFLARSPHDRAFDDDAVSVGSANSFFGHDTFEEKDFILPPEEPIDKRELKKYRDRLDRSQRNFEKRVHDCRNATTFKKLDEFEKVDNSTLSRKGINERALTLQTRRALLEAQNDLSTIQAVVTTKQVFPEDAELYTNLDVSSADHPSLGSIEEKIEDLRQDEVEKWCKRRGRTVNARFTNQDKRLLREWFRKLDDDGSGEVNVNELQDPMLSSGILKTREQVLRVLTNVDKNRTMGIDFEEFLIALQGNKLADGSKLKHLQDMSSNPLGFAMDTLLTEERRKKLLRSVVDEMQIRQRETEKCMAKLIKMKLNRRERDRFQIDLEKLEERHKKSKELHDKYIDALDVVVQENIAHENEQVMNEPINTLTNTTTSILNQKTEVDSSMFPSPGNHGKPFVSDLLQRNPYSAYGPFNGKTTSSTSNSKNNNSSSKLVTSGSAAIRRK